MISTHVLDLNSGQPAQAIQVLLEKKHGESWILIQESKTNADGRIVFQCPQEKGYYRLTFAIEEYLKSKNQTPFFVNCPVVFVINDTQRKYHVPLLLSPFGYSTYRGS